MKKNPHIATPSVRSVLPVRLILILTLALVSFSLYSQDWDETIKIIGSETDFNDQFGEAVAIGCDYIAIGSSNDNDAGGNSGSVYVFEHPADEWTELAKITAFDAAAGDNFGVSVAVGHDRVIVGAKGDDDGGSGSGSVYIYDIVDGAIIGETKITASDAAAGDNFGVVVDIDNDRLVVGATGTDVGGTNSGSVYIFEFIGGAWVEVSKLTASDADAEDLFGESVSINNDRLVIGARKEDAEAENAGAVYVFELIGGTWLEVEKLTASDPQSEDLFGSSVSVYDNFLAVGATGDDDAGLSSGAVYMFELVGGGWTEIGKFLSSDADAGGFFGASVSLMGDKAVFGSYGDDAVGALSGAAYVYEYTGGIWTEALKLTASDMSADDLFGEAVAIHGDQIVTGARYNDDSGLNSGTAYVFGDFSPLIVTAVASPSGVCLGDPVTLTGAGADVYTWNEGITNGVPFIPDSLGEHTYTVEGVEEFTGCRDEAEIMVTVNASPTVFANSSSEVACEGQMITLTGSGSADTYEWSGGVIDGIAFNPPDGTSTYTVTGTVYATGCTSTASIDVTVVNTPSPIAEFTYDPGEIDVQNTWVSFYNESSYADSYTWSFGDGSPTTDEVNPEHEFPVEGNKKYWVTLTATSELGCEDVAKKLITIKDILIYYVPNAFTPDGDSFNDEFMPVFHSGVDIYNYHLMIFNRWGELVFESYDPEFGWSGTYGDLGLVQDGVYVWRVEFKETMSDKRHYQEGTVSVIK